jgi:hypothetical protein
MREQAGNDRASAAMGELASPGSMVFSAVIFGFFGFFMGPVGTISVVTGQFLLYVALFNWTMQIFAIVSLGCALLTMVNPRLGNGLFAVAGLAAAALFVIIAIMDWLDPSMIFPYAPFVLLFFAAWNGYGSWTCLRALLGMKSAGAVSPAA